MGLLFGSDTDDSTEDLPEALSFQHKLIQEMLAAYYIAEQVKSNESLLKEMFPSWDVIKQHREVLQFTCGLLASTETSAKPVVDYVSKLLVDLTLEELSTGNRVSIMYIYMWVPPLSDGFRLLSSLEREGSVYESSLNPYLVEYPRCHHLLTEVLANSMIVYINGFNGEDIALTRPSKASVILDAQYFKMSREKYHDVWKVLHSTRSKLISIDVDVSEYDNEDGFVDRGEFTEELTQHLKSHGSDNQLMRCSLIHSHIPSDVLSCISLCKQLRKLDMRACNLKARVHMLMNEPPPTLNVLTLEADDLCTEDVEEIARAIQARKLCSLKRLDISRNVVGELVLERLLETFLDIRGKEKHPLLQLALGATVPGYYEEMERPSSTCTGFDEEDWADWSYMNYRKNSQDPPGEFIQKWNQKLRELLNIQVAWHINKFPE